MGEETKTKASEEDVTQLPRYVMPTWLYQLCKWVTLVALPLASVAYPQLAGIWGLPMADQVAQTCSVLALVLGVSIGVSQLGGSIRKGA